MSDRLGAAWRRFRTQVIPLDAPAIQARECRRAFYGGASALLGIILAGVGDDPEAPTTAEELALMQDLDAELQQFAREIKAGRA